MGAVERALPELRVEPDARDFVVAAGGRIYVWEEGAGLKYVSLKQPHRDVSFQEIRDGDITLYQDVTIGSPEWWTVILRHFPRKHVDALWNGAAPGGRPVFPTGMS